MKEDEIEAILNVKTKYYNNVKISKKNGLRKLSCIEGSSPLYDLQQNLKVFFDKIPIANNVFGFVKGYGYKDFLKPHINRKYYLRVDIKNFFDSIDKELLKSVLEYYVKIDEILDLIIDVVTLDEVLPQGGVTSPVLSNIVFRQLDIRIQKYCKKLNFEYSRYADDLLFSSNNYKLLDKSFIRVLENILISQEFELNYSKIIKEKDEISLNGLVVGKNIRLSRKRRKDINKILFLYNKGGEPKNISEYLNRLNNTNFNYLRKEKDENFETAESLIQCLCGYRSFLIDWSLDENKDYYGKHQDLIENIEELIDKIIKI
jgi:hypothetical protein